MRSGRGLNGEQVNEELRIEGLEVARQRREDGHSCVVADSDAHRAASECVGAVGDTARGPGLLLSLCSEHFETPGSV